MARFDYVRVPRQGEDRHHHDTECGPVASLLVDDEIAWKGSQLLFLRSGSIEGTVRIDLRPGQHEIVLKIRVLDVCDRFVVAIANEWIECTEIAELTASEFKPLISVFGSDTRSDFTD